MQKQEEQAYVYLQYDQTQQPEAQEFKTKKGLMRFPFSRTIKNFVVSRKIEAELQTSNWRFSSRRINMIIMEMFDWKQSYLPLNLAGLTVLDVGAGEGETAKFFLENGAAKVVCIESCTQAYRYLAHNADAHPELSAINKRFSLSDLSLPHDFLKCDIEGYEEELLGIELSVPAVVEIHGLQLRDKFKRKGWRIFNFNNLNDYGCTNYAYWMC